MHAYMQVATVEVQRLVEPKGWFASVDGAKLSAAVRYNKMRYDQRR